MVRETLARIITELRDTAVAQANRLNEHPAMNGRALPEEQQAWRQADDLQAVLDKMLSGPKQTTGHYATRQALEEAILDRADLGYSHRRIAGIVGVSQPTVTSIVKKHLTD